jgi:hypothetical protein
MRTSAHADADRCLPRAGFFLLTSPACRHILNKSCFKKRSNRMKKALLLLLVIAAFFSCKSLPSPKHAEDSLIIGSLIWDFPDGFFDLAPRTLKIDIFLTLVNLTTGKLLKVRVSDGYYNFLVRGNDKYMLQYAKYKSSGGPKTYTLGYQLNLQIECRPAGIIYPGHIKITFASPEQVEVKEGDAMIRTNWRFRESYTVENKIEDIKAYLKENDTKNKWQDYKILNLYEK